MTTSPSPRSSTATLSPLLVVFAVACLGVLVEAFVPRKHRFLAQATLAVGGVVLTLAATSLRLQAEGARRRRDSARGIFGSMGTDRGRRAQRVPLGPGPAVFALGGSCSSPSASRRRRLGVRRSGRRTPRHRGRAQGRRPRPHRGLPAAALRRPRHDAVPGRRRPGHHVRRPRGALAAAVPPLRPGPPPPAAQPGSRAQVLRARRLLLRLLPLRRRAHLRLRRLDGLRRHQRGGPQQLRPTRR